jgi:hypothetical protein
MNKQYHLVLSKSFVFQVRNFFCEPIKLNLLNNVKSTNKQKLMDIIDQKMGSSNYISFFVRFHEILNSFKHRIRILKKKISRFCPNGTVYLEWNEYF